VCLTVRRLMHTWGCGKVQSGYGLAGSYKVEASRSRLERRAIEGESPVCESGRPPGPLPSSVGHVKPGVNLGGPPPKAKYKSMTDSVLVA